MLAVVGGTSTAGCVDRAPVLDPASVFEGVEDYGFNRLPPTFERDVQHAYLANPDLADHVTDVEIRTVVDPGGEAVALAMVLAVDPDVVGGPGFDRQVAEGFSAEAGSPMQEIRVGGQRVFEGTPIGVLGGTHALIWREANLVVVLLGERPRDDRAAAEAMIGRRSAES
ncbi:MAG: hypothetical protein ACRDI0_06205 [Actinomycetota bacterium]